MVTGLTSPSVGDVYTVSMSCFWKGHKVRIISGPDEKGLYTTYRLKSDIEVEKPLFFSKDSLTTEEVDKCNDEEGNPVFTRK